MRSHALPPAVLLMQLDRRIGTRIALYNQGDFESRRMFGALPLHLMALPTQDGRLLETSDCWRICKRSRNLTASSESENKAAGYEEWKSPL